MTPTMEEVAGWLREAAFHVVDLADECLTYEATVVAMRAKNRAAQVETMGWRAIDSAPKNGTAILVYTRHGQYVVSWDTDELWWYVDDNKHGPYPLRGDVPTHFMPLPQPPVTK